MISMIADLAERDKDGHNSMTSFSWMSSAGTPLLSLTERFSTSTAAPCAALI
jgi:hypothetical protein